MKKLLSKYIQGIAQCSVNPDPRELGSGGFVLSLFADGDYFVEATYEDHFVLRDPKGVYLTVPYSAIAVLVTRTMPGLEKPPMK